MNNRGTMGIIDWFLIINMFIICMSLVAIIIVKSNKSEIIPLPKEERIVINKVANEYGLIGDARLLLFVIRKVENGRPGREFGVLNPEAMRFFDGRLSFLIQARWAAGTIKKRYTGDLKAFADRWCPVGAINDPKGLNKNWLSNVLFYMDKWKVEK